MTKSYFFCGIGGSGMLPLALILQGQGESVSGSDRSRDQGKLPEKFIYIEKTGIKLFPQDGSGITPDTKALVVSTAVEDTIPDVKAAKDTGIPIIHRSEMLAERFHKAETKIAIAGTSGKTTVTGMAGFMLKELSLDPTVMNGGVFRNYADQNPFCSAFVGKGDCFVTEADESDGSIALYNPDIAVINNIALDHKPLKELETLFDEFIKRTGRAILNIDNKYVVKLAQKHAGKSTTFSIINSQADLYASDIQDHPDRIEAHIRLGNEKAHLKLGLPGRHNLSNALAAIGTVMACGISLKQACDALAKFKGIKRRMEITGSKNGITVIDDFAHNPDKITATVKSLKATPGRLLIFFQPHGYGFLKLVAKELADTFSAQLSAEDRLLMVEPYYAGGTVDRSVGSADIVSNIPNAVLCEDRSAVRQALLENAKSGDKIIIMGARDDTLSDFAQEILHALPG